MSSVGSSVRCGIARSTMPLQERSSGGLPELEGRQPDGGEGWVEVGSERDVVEADDRDVVGDPATRLAQGADRPERDDVAGHEGRVEGGPCEQPGHRDVAAGGVEVGLRDQIAVDVDAGGQRAPRCSRRAVPGPRCRRAARW